MEALIAWFGDHMSATWLAVAMVLGLAELVSLDLILLMLAGGALAGVVASLFLPVSVQVIVAVLTAVGMLAFVRPSVVKRLHGGPDLVTGHQKLVGKQGVVISEVSCDAGQVRIAGEVWTARPYDDDAVIEPGARVDVFEIRGATALVHKIPELDA
jgi:membrane protein implicated in regulation of membrane protease activity